MRVYRGKLFKDINLDCGDGLISYECEMDC